ncbi:CDP-glycerol glycerophosphotransferase family protein [Actinomadura sp. CNU-125]|uniref:CDP-glycerol glycerophosphotransferase family protein n=1 Tax=Actinomadura sp. CNU-125 TaxID=1904961 RepID=UPI003967C4B4
MVDRYDCFLVRSDHDVRTLCPALGVRAPLLPSGYPRNDPLVAGADGDPELAAEIAALRRSLGLDRDGRRVLLYAPTFATGPRGRPVRTLEPPIDPDVFARELGDEFVLLLRPHYLCRADLPPSARAFMRDAGGVPDVTPLLLLADALITDRSSIVFDFALLDRPIVLHLPDDPSDRGGDPGAGYVDLERDAPGPITRTADGLVAALAGLDAAEAVHAPRRARSPRGSVSTTAARRRGRWWNATSPIGGGHAEGREHRRRGHRCGTGRLHRLQQRRRRRGAPAVGPPHGRGCSRRAATASPSSGSPAGRARPRTIRRAPTGWRRCTTAGGRPPSPTGRARRATAWTWPRGDGTCGVRPRSGAAPPGCRNCSPPPARGPS